MAVSFFDHLKEYAQTEQASPKAPPKTGATNCSYLDTYKTMKESAKLFQGGPSAEAAAKEKFDELTVKAQNKFFDYCSNGTKALPKKSNSCGESIVEAFMDVDEVAKKQFMKLKTGEKISKMEGFLRDSAAQKIENECRDAEIQGKEQVETTTFPTVPIDGLRKNVNSIGAYLCIFLGILLAFVSYSAGKYLVQQGTNELSKAVIADDTQLISLKSGHSIGIAHMKGLRDNMEDEHLATTISFSVGSTSHEAEVYAIFDGHGGNDASEYLRDHFAEHLKKSLGECNAGGISDEGKFAAFKEAFINVDKAYLANKSEGYVGSTATVAVIIDDELWVANVGDSRTVLCDGKTPIQCSEDQKCDNGKYAKGVEKRGGMISPDRGGTLRVNGTLSTARAVGDNKMKGRRGYEVVVHTPKVTKFKLSELKPNSVLILGCDGVWDVCTTKQAVDFVSDNYHQPADVIADQLVGKAYAAGSTDNISAMVIKLGSGNPTKA